MHCQTDAVARAAAELSPAERAVNGLDPNPPQISSNTSAAVVEAVAGLSQAEVALNGLDTAVADSRTADDARGPAPLLPPSLRPGDGPSNSIDVPALCGPDDPGYSSRGTPPSPNRPTSPATNRPTFRMPRPPGGTRTCPGHTPTTPCVTTQACRASGCAANPQATTP